MPNFMNIKPQIVFFLLLFTANSFGQIDRLPESLASQIDQSMEEELLFQELYGMSIGIVQDGKIVYTKGYGHMDVNRQVPVTNSTVFNWASISKTLTAVAAFQLIEAKKLKKTSKAKNILKEIWTNEDDKDQITVGHLLSHRSGIRHYNNDRGDDIKADYSKYTDRNIRSDWNAAQSVAIFNDLKLKTLSNEEYRYSTFGYNLLGAVIEKVSDKGYVGHITNHILRPLDTKSINVSRKPWKAFYKDCNGAALPWEEGEKRTVLPGGGWHSNIGDITIFMNALINNRLLKKTSALWTSVTKGGKILDNNGYRFGMKTKFDSIITENDSVKIEARVLHAGKHENVRTLLTFYPDSKLGFCMFLNGGYGDEKRVFRKLATLLGKTQKGFDGPQMKREYHRNCAKDITGIWTSGEEKSLVRFGYDRLRFIDEIVFLNSKGYELTDCEYFVQNDALLCTGIFKKVNATEYILPSEYSTFQKILSEYQKANFYLDDLEVFNFENKLLWSAVLAKKSKKPLFLNGLNKRDFENEKNRLRRDGYGLTDLEIHELDGQFFYNGLFLERLDSEVELLQTKTDFADTRRMLASNDRHLIDLELVKVNDEILFSGVFHKSSPSVVGFRSTRTYTGIADQFNIKAAQNEQLIDIEKPFHGF